MGGHPSGDQCWKKASSQEGATLDSGHISFFVSEMILIKLYLFLTNESTEAHGQCVYRGINSGPKCVNLLNSSKPIFL